MLERGRGGSPVPLGGGEKGRSEVGMLKSHQLPTNSTAFQGASGSEWLSLCKASSTKTLFLMSVLFVGEKLFGEFRVVRMGEPDPHS